MNFSELGHTSIGGRMTDTAEAELERYGERVKQWDTIPELNTERGAGGG
jgi:hypothetical protein